MKLGWWNATVIVFTWIFGSTKIYKDGIRVRWHNVYLLYKD